ncbi:MAG: LysR family transcriptional regulator [Pseudomonadales bacterium]|nr:LysR family transcriptional regulator [Pseudomonadales bacterium]
MRITLKQLEVFVAIAQEGTVLKAADRLSLTQSASSMSLADLERQLGRQLFDRVGRRLQLNDTGNLLLPKAIDILSRTEDLEKQAANDSSEMGQLRIGSSLTIGGYLIPSLMGTYLRNHPSSRLSLDMGNTRHVIENLEKFHIDIGFIEGYCHAPEIDVLPWQEDELVIFVGKDHPLACTREVTLDDLAHCDWILREPGSGTRETFDHAVFGKLAQIKMAMELSQTEAIKHVVESGFGVGCLSRISLHDAITQGRLVPLSTPYLNLRRKFLILIHRQKYRGGHLNRFVEFCLGNQIS